MNHTSRRTFIGIAAGAAAATPLLEAMTPQAAAPASAISIEKDVVYGKGGTMDLRLDIYHPPKGKENRMATIHLHGGGFGGGSKETLLSRVSPIAALGYTAIVSQYRLSGQGKWPAQLEDVRSAIRWVRANADRLGINPERVAVFGYSAGGFLAFSAAAMPEPGTPPLAACVGHYPIVDIHPGKDGKAHALLPEGSNEAAHLSASPTSHIAAGFPPTIIFQGTADTTVPLEGTQKLFQQLRDAKVRAELHTFEGQPHVFDSTQPVFADACAHLADMFLDRVILNPPAKK